MKNKKGLTLIELLGVIVILGIIALIAYPLMTNIVENIRKDAFIANIDAFVDAAEKDALTYRGESDTFVYFILKDSDNSISFHYSTSNESIDEIKNNATYYDAEISFNKDLGFKQGAIKIVFNDKGPATIEIIEPFMSNRYKTEGSDEEPLSLPVERKHLKPANE